MSEATDKSPQDDGFPKRITPEQIEHLRGGLTRDLNTLGEFIERITHLAQRKSDLLDFLEDNPEAAREFGVAVVENSLDELQVCAQYVNKVVPQVVQDLALKQLGARRPEANPIFTFHPGGSC